MTMNLSEWKKTRAVGAALQKKNAHHQQFNMAIFGNTVHR
jgi:hypothetical protein